MFESMFTQFGFQSPYDEEEEQIQEPVAPQFQDSPYQARGIESLFAGQSPRSGFSEEARRIAKNQAISALGQMLLSAAFEHDPRKFGARIASAMPAASERYGESLFKVRDDERKTEERNIQLAALERRAKLDEHAIRKADEDEKLDISIRQSAAGEADLVASAFYEALDDAVADKSIDEATANSQKQAFEAVRRRFLANYKDLNAYNAMMGFVDKAASAAGKKEALDEALRVKREESAGSRGYDSFGAFSEATRKSDAADLNQKNASAGLTAAQTEMIKEGAEEAGYTPEDIAYLKSKGLVPVRVQSARGNWHWVVRSIAGSEEKVDQRTREKDVAALSKLSEDFEFRGYVEAALSGDSATRKQATDRIKLRVGAWIKPSGKDGSYTPEQLQKIMEITSSPEAAAIFLNAPRENKVASFAGESPNKSEFTPVQEQNIQKFMQANNKTREEAIEILRRTGWIK